MVNKLSLRGYILVFVALSMGCGVKDRPSTNDTFSPVASGNLPTGVWTTQEKKFLIHPSKPGFAIGEQTVVYKIMTSSMDLVSTPDYSLQLKYGMPAMPQMPVTPAKIEFSKPGEIQVGYDISMGGDWEFILSIFKNGVEVDKLIYSFNVPD